MTSPNKRKPAKPTHIGTILENLVSEFRKDSGLTRIWSLWDKVVDENIARNSKLDAFKDSLLLVNVTSTAWIQELQFKKKEIIENLNKALGFSAVSDIRFKVGSID